MFPRFAQPLLISLGLAACGPAPESSPTESALASVTDAADAICLDHLPIVTIDDRSLILSDLPALAARDVTLRRVLGTLAAQTPNPNDTADTLYASMVATGMHGVGAPTVLDEWYGVAFVNRFDLASSASCGEYRLVVSRERHRGPPPTFHLEQDEFALIFEASVANPQPQLGRAGCAPLLRRWGYLSSLKDPVERAAALEAMYFIGVDGFPPIVHIDHYGALGRGQVRGNFFLNASDGPWRLDEFAIRRPVASSRLWGVEFVNRPVADVLGISIVAAGPPADATVAALRADFIAQLGALAAPDPFSIRFSVAEPYRAAIATASANPINEGYVGPANIPGNFLNAGGDSSDFGQQIAAGMLARNITGITPTQMVRRSFTQTCGGCHDDARADIGGGATWPVNTPNRVFIIGRDGSLSGPLVAFLPQRRANLQAFLSCEGASHDDD